MQVELKFITPDAEAHIGEAAAECYDSSTEREACAKVCDDNADCCHPGSVLHSVLGANAVAIRARGQA